MSKKNKARDYLINNVKKPLEVVIKRVLKKKPDDPIPLILSALEEAQGINNEPLTPEERMELDALRGDYDKYNRKLKRLQEDDEEMIEEAKSELQTITRKHQDEEDETESEEEDDEPLGPLPDSKKGKDRKPRTSVSAEAFGAWNKKSDFKATVVPKNDETKGAVRARLMKSFLFNSLDPKDLEIVIDAMTEVKLVPGQTVIKEGDDGDYLYVVEKGRLQCSKIFKGNTTPTNLIVYEPGGAFGELALLYNAPRAATITAIDD